MNKYSEMSNEDLNKLSAEIVADGKFHDRWDKSHPGSLFRVGKVIFSLVENNLNPLWNPAEDSNQLDLIEDTLIDLDFEIMTNRKKNGVSGIVDIDFYSINIYKDKKLMASMWRAKSGRSIRQTRLTAMVEAHKKLKGMEG